MPLRVKNWTKFQHYKKRNPPWIKVHVDILISEDWVMTPDPLKGVLIAIMVVASKHDGYIPNNPEYIKRVANLDKLPNLQHFIEQGFLIIENGDASNMLADASTLQADACSSVSVSVSDLKNKSLPTWGNNPRPSRWNERLEESFMSFWNDYPRKVDKGDARKSWKTINPDDDLLAEIMNGLARWNNSTNWLEGDKQFIKYPATWLNACSWEIGGDDE